MAPARSEPSDHACGACALVVLTPAGKTLVRRAIKEIAAIESGIPGR